MSPSNLQSAHNQETGCQELLKGFAVHLLCHDFRAVKLLFIPHKKAVHAAVEIQADKKGRHRLRAQLKAFTSVLKDLPVARSTSWGTKVNQVCVLLDSGCRLHVCTEDRFHSSVYLTFLLLLLAATCGTLILQEFEVLYLKPYVYMYRTVYIILGVLAFYCLDRTLLIVLKYDSIQLWVEL